MKSFINTIFILLSLSFYFSSIAQDLEQVFPNENLARMEQIVMDDSGYGYAIGECNAFTTTSDGGETWIDKSLPSISYFNSKIHILSSGNGQYILFTNGLKIYKSIDAGDSWNEVKTGIEFNEIGKYINFANTINGDIIVLTFNGAILKSSDDGGSWVKIETGAEVRLNKISVSPEGGIWVYDNRFNIYFSKDHGDSWNLIYNHGVRLSSLQFINNKVGFLLDFDRKIFKTIDGGLNWTRHMKDAALITSSMYVRSETEFWFNNNRVIFITKDEGVSFQTLNPPIGVNMWFRDIYFKGDNEIWMSGTNRAIIGSKDNGLTWNLKNDVLARDLNQVIVEGDKIYSCGNYGLLLTSDDNGISWKKEILGSFSIRNLVLKNDGSLLLATNEGLKIYKDGQVTAHDDIPNPMINIKKISKSGVIMAISNRPQNQLWISKDDGLTWLLQYNFPFGVRGVEMFSDNNFIVFGGRTEIRRTIDGGSSWQDIKIEDINYITSVHRIDDDNLIVASTNKLYFSSDKGRNFTVRNLPSGLTPIFSFVTPEIGYISLSRTYDSQLYETTDGGQNWTLKGNTCNLIQDVIINIEDHQLWGVGKGGAIHRLENILDRTINIQDQFINNSLVITPNPNTGVFTLSVNGESFLGADVDIFNVQGLKISSHSHFNSGSEISLPTNVSSGIYWISVINKNKHFVGKMYVD